MKYILDIAQDCREYAHKYSCTLEEAVQDYEGYDEGGSYGLTAEEKNLVLKALGVVEEYDPYAYDY